MTTPIELEQGHYQKVDRLCGVDEVGRGPLAGPVVSAAVCIQSTRVRQLMETLHQLKINDSKKLTAKKRRRICEDMGVWSESMLNDDPRTIDFGELGQVTMAIGFCDPAVIDDINILQASLLSMKKAIERLELPKKGTHILIDGTFIPKGLDYSCESLIKGDSRSLAIGLASIFAKEARDQEMEAMALKYPEYGLDKHKGYPTAFHKSMLEKWGPSPIHRLSFSGVNDR